MNNHLEPLMRGTCARCGTIVRQHGNGRWMDPNAPDGFVARCKGTTMLHYVIESESDDDAQSLITQLLTNNARYIDGNITLTGDEASLILDFIMDLS